MAILLAAAPAGASPSPREDLKAVVARIQATPGDRALREKAIALAAKLKPAPAVPPEAKRSFVMAGTFQKEAKSPDDFALAVGAYQDALKIAPWWGDAYFNLSVALESAGRLDEAKGALELYLLTKPKDAEAAQNRLYALDAKNILATKQSAAASNAAAASEAAAAAKIRTQRSIEGPWYLVLDNGWHVPDITVVRTEGGFEVKSNAVNGTIKNVKATETTLSYTFLISNSDDVFDLHREGDSLVGTHISTIGNNQSVTGMVRMVRQP